MELFPKVNPHESIGSRSFSLEHLSLLSKTPVTMFVTQECISKTIVDLQKDQTASKAGISTN